MRRTLPLTLALLVIIVVMLIVNLFIGSVKIPLADICCILVGAGSESEIWTNIVLSSRLPQSLTAIDGVPEPAGRPFDIGNFQRCQSGRCICCAPVGAVGRGGTQPLGIFGRCCHFCSSDNRSTGSDGAHHLDIG